MIAISRYLFPAILNTVEIATAIGMREIAADLRQIVPQGAFRHVIPMEQRLQPIGALVRELRDGELADDPYIKMSPKW